MHIKTILIIMAFIIICFLGCVIISRNKTDKKINLEQNSPNIKAIKTNKNIEHSAYKTYINNRYGFRIDYPSKFETTFSSDNNDGVLFTNQQDGAELKISGISNISGDKTISPCNDLLNESDKFTYRKQENNWVVATWVEGEKIVYEKCVVEKGSINSFIIKYPSSKKEEYDSILTRLNSSFRTTPVKPLR